MKISFKSPPLKLMAMSASIVSSIILSSCGGGGGGSSSSNFTERPKTLDDIILTLDDVGITMEFRRSSNSPREATVTNPETGSVGYRALSFDGNEEASLGAGGIMEIHYPLTFQTLSYTYQPINDISGLLTLHALGGSHFFNVVLRPSIPFVPNRALANHISVFPDSSPLRQPGLQWNPNFLLTFVNDGITITDVTIIARPENVTNINIFTGALPLAIPNVPLGAPLPPPALANLADGSYSTGGAVITNTGFAVPVNYTQDELTGTIADMSLDGLLFIFTPTTADATNPLAVLSPPFSMLFENAEEITSGDLDETGNATYTLTQTGTELIGNLEYEYDFTDGTDTSTAVIRGNVPNATTGTYTLNYTSSLIDNAGILRRGGNYVISAPGQPYDGEIGTFIANEPSF